MLSSHVKKQKEMEKKVIDLGWMNGWEGEPEEYKAAMKALGEHRPGYSLKSYAHGSCATEYRITTPDYIISYKIDSSD